MAKSFTAIIVDANNSARKSLASIIKQSYVMRDVYSSSCAREASAVLRQIDSIDWVFFDNELSDRDSFEFLKEIKELKSTENAKFIMTSSEANRDTLIKAATSGVNAFVAKPFTPKIILDKMQKFVDGKVQRKAQRVDLFEAFEATIHFKEAKYRSVLVDISVGGCKIKSSLYSQGGGMIYDKAKIRVPFEDSIMSLDSQLIRLERDVSSAGDEEPKIIAAFVFKELQEKYAKLLAEFLAKIKSSK